MKFRRHSSTNVVFLFILHIFLYWLTVFILRDRVGTLSHRHVAPLVVFNQLSSIVWYPIFTNLPLSPLGWRLPIEIIEIIVVNSFIFGAFHSVIHDCRPLKWIHDIHHQMVIPTGSGALYAHPLEHLFVVIGSIACTVILVPVSYDAILLFTAIASVNTVYAHTPGTSHAHHHHSHPSKNRSNFPPLWDIWRGTFQVHQNTPQL